MLEMVTWKKRVPIQETIIVRVFKYERRQQRCLKEPRITDLTGQHTVQKYRWNKALPNVGFSITVPASSQSFYPDNTPKQSYRKSSYAWTMKKVNDRINKEYLRRSGGTSHEVTWEPDPVWTSFAGEKPLKRYFLPIVAQRFISNFLFCFIAGNTDIHVRGVFAWVNVMEIWSIGWRICARKQTI